MQSFVRLVLRVNLDFQFSLIVFHEYRGVVDKCALNRATNLLPGLVFVVKLESYDKHDHFVNVYSDVSLLCQSL